MPPSDICVVMMQPSAMTALLICAPLILLAGRNPVLRVNEVQVIKNCTAEPSRRGRGSLQEGPHGFNVLPVFLKI
jgi:hypothetical protein